MLKHLLLAVLWRAVLGDSGLTSLPISEPQMDQLVEEVCNIGLWHYDTCKKEFKSAAPRAPDAAATVSRAHAQYARVTLPPARARRLVLLLPRNDTDAIVTFAVLPPNETSASVETGAGGPLDVWYAALDRGGRPRRWHAGPPVPPFVPLNLTYVVRLDGDFELDDRGDEVLLEGVFSWNSSVADDQFDVVNFCQKSGEISSTTITPSGAVTSLRLRSLPLEDRCELNVTGLHGRGALQYRTPVCARGYCAPERVHNVSVYVTATRRAWDVRVAWARPRRAPREVRLSLEADAVQNATVAGNATSVTFKNVSGTDYFYLDIATVNSKGKENVISKTFRFPKRDPVPTTLLAAAAAAVTAALALAAGLLLLYMWWQRRRRHARRRSYFKGLDDKLSKDLALLLPEEDRWEVRPERLALHEVVGEGAFGVVRRGTLAPLGIEVAVKMLKECPSVEEIRSFRSEMELMKSVGAHAHVVSLLGVSGARLLLVAEYCSRGDLLNYLRCAWNVMVSKRNAKYYNNNVDYKALKPDRLVVNKLYELQDVCDEDLTAVDLLSFCRQIAMGMKFLAANRVVHRDLAARNVLVTADRTLKIADFGLSRDVYQENQYKQKGNGKLPIKWMALESLTQNIYTSQSDVWSFGIVVWEVVTVGASPYPGVSAAQLPRLLRRGYRMPRPNNCSKQLYELMQSCWRARGRDRPTFATLHRQLDALLGGACDAYLSLDFEPEEPAATGRKYFGIIPRSKRYWSTKAYVYERPLSAPQSNHYTSPPAGARQLPPV